MGITLTSKTINSTYDSLLKLSDNDSLTGAFKVITDGLGNDTGISINNTGNVTISGTLVVNTKIQTPLLQLTGGTGTQGEMSWNTDEETVDVILNGSTLQLGQEVHVHVRNNYQIEGVGQDIPNGTPVYVTGTLGASGRLTIAPMIADGTISAEYFIGVTTEDIAYDTDGKVTWFGKVRGFDTSGYTEGIKLYVSETVAGGWQTTEPTAPNPKLEVAFTVNKKSNGTIFVRGGNGQYLHDNHDVKITSASNGDLLVYNSTDEVWENSSTITASYLRFTGDVDIDGDLNIDGGDLTSNATGFNLLNLNVTTVNAFGSASNVNMGMGTTNFYMSGNMEVTGNTTSASFIKSGGASTEFLKADGSVDSTTYQNVTEKGQALGYVPLDSGAKIDESYLPDSIVGQVEYQGTWNAATNTPTLSTSTTPKGHYYIVSVGGTFDSITYAVGDWIISDGTTWNKVDNTDAVTDFNGRLGSIVPLSTDYDSFFYTKTLLDSGQLDTRYYTETEIGNFFSGGTVIAGYNKSNWDTAYTYSQVGHLPLTGGTVTGNLQVNGYIRGNGQQLVLNAGESYTYATGQTSEYVYINAEAGLEINSSPDNWATGWAGRKTAYINKADGTSSLPGTLTITGNGNSSQWNTAYGWGNWSVGVNKAFVDALNVNADTLDSLSSGDFLRANATDTATGNLTFSGINTFNGSATFNDDITLNHSATGQTVDGITITNVDTADTGVLSVETGNKLTWNGDALVTTVTAGQYVVNTGDTMTGSLTIENTAPLYKLKDNNSTGATDSYGQIKWYDSTDTELAAVGFYGADSKFYIDAKGNDVYMPFGGANTVTINGTGIDISGNTVLHSRNYTSYTDSKYLRSDTSDTMSGTLTIGRPTGLASIKAGTTSGGNLVLDSSGGMVYLNNYVSDNVVLATGGGNVGIGTTSPSARLEIETAGATGTEDIAVFSRATYGEVLKITRASGEAVLNANSNLTLSADYNNSLTSVSSNIIFKTDSTERMRIDSSGNVGINTQTQAGTNGLGLAIYASDYPRLTFRNSTTGDTTGDGTQFAGVGNNFQIVNKEAGDLLFSTNNTERMRIDSSGNLSLATATSLDFNVSDFAQIKFKESGAITIDSDNNQSSRNFQFKDGDGSSLMFIGDNGNVGIGTTSPSAKLHLSSIESVDLRIDADTDNAGSENHNPRLFLTQDGGGIQSIFGINGDTNAQFTGAIANGAYWKTNASIQFLTNNTISATIDTNNRIGIGNFIDPQTLLELRGSSPYLTISNTAETDAGIYFNDYQAGINPASSSQAAAIKWSSGDNILRFYNNDANALRMAIDTAGTVYCYNNVIVTGYIRSGSGSQATPAIQVGDTDTGFYDSGTNTIGVSCAGVIKFNFEANGTFRASGDVVAYYSFSDARLKTNVKPLENSLEKVKQLQGVSYEWIDGERKGKTEVGLIAQEVEKVVPEVVREQKRLGDDTEYKTVDYEKLVGVLIEAIKEQQEQIDELKRRLDERS